MDERPVYGKSFACIRAIEADFTALGRLAREIAFDME